MSTRAIVERIYDCWARGNIDGVLELAHEDVCYTVHLNPEVLPTAGTSQGKALIRQKLEAIAAMFEFVNFVFEDITAEGHQARSQLWFHYRHKETRHELLARCRHLWVLEGEKVRSLEEFHDAGRLEAFITLVKGQPPSQGNP